MSGARRRPIRSRRLRSCPPISTKSDRRLPPGVEIATYEVASDALSARIWLLVKNGLGGLLVVVAILFLFLNARIAFWVAAGIPVAMLATIGFMYASGQTINMISLFSLIMMLGIIVDDAIVVGEHTATRLQMGDDPQTAAENGVQHDAHPGDRGDVDHAGCLRPDPDDRRYNRPDDGVLPMVVIAVLIASLLECFLMLPGHLANSLAGRKPPGWSWWRQFLVAGHRHGFLTGLSGRLAVDLALGAEDSGVRAAARGFADLPQLARMAIVVAVSLALATLLEWGLLAFCRRNSATQPRRRPCRGCRREPLPARIRPGLRLVSAMAPSPAWCNWPGAGAM
jgi:hypothetical protein